MSSSVIQFYQNPGLAESEKQAVLKKAQAVTDAIKSIQTEFCFYVDCRGLLPYQSSPPNECCSHLVSHKL